MHIVFFFFHYQDIDQNAPVAWRLLREGHRITSIVLDPHYDRTDDPRLVFLRKWENYQEMDIASALGWPGARWLFKQQGYTTTGFARRGLRKILRTSGISVRRARSVLRDLGADVCVFEWGGTGARNRADFLLAADSLGLRTLCLPHGVHIYRNSDVRATALDPNSRAGYNGYDAYIYQTAFHRDSQTALGQDPSICHVLGSARFCPEWMPINDQLYDDFEPAGDVGDRLKIVLMLPQWRFKVDQPGTLAAIQRIAEQDWAYLTIKGHTRQGFGGLPAEFAARMSKLPNVETIGDEVPSTPLIRWADCTVNFMSSIGLETLVRDQPLVSPHYLHGNFTVLDERQATIGAENEDKLIAMLEALAGPNPPHARREARDASIREVIYGGHQPFDILDAYSAIVRGAEVPTLVPDTTLSDIDEDPILVT